MKTVLAYTVVTNGPISMDLASKFVVTLDEYPPGAPFELLVICNGGPLRTELGLLFTPFAAKFFPRPNDPNWDIGGYIEAARGPAHDADLMVCLGESCFFNREGWLKRTVEAWTRGGAGMYGFFSSNAVRAHMNTTAFATHPMLLREYNRPVSNHAERYEFEHGDHSFWRYVRGRGMATKLITWDGEWDPNLWRYPKNILWRGDQSNLLFGCNHTDRYETAPPDIKTHWSRSADAAFR